MERDVVETMRRLREDDERVAGLRAASTSGTGALVPVMALRDYFAAAALVGLMVSPRSPTVYGADRERVALAWEYADRMLAARSSGPAGPREAE